ncbi:uncharacterized PE-PGRS family protein PE_PGRS46-like [Hemicordylus capensis]|uniref:uncharacterized PE-PGRS family protein PE_PGRS46-like n=1 Tax=Hemicordylus capensis TaxID=884348 RepID=UPI0023040632|nr:uncharacterized PE-PGRS family protein PE_PGRS46-like [Hemicordylus capensis]XP_053157412.1 uncharacterized PE-PGRS family protein PE_PGRS46-like [Hemicordylus capensis]
MAAGGPGLATGGGCGPSLATAKGQGGEAGGRAAGRWPAAGPVTRAEGGSGGEVAGLLLAARTGKQQQWAQQAVEAALGVAGPPAGQTAEAALSQARRPGQEEPVGDWGGREPGGGTFQFAAEEERWWRPVSAGSCC